MPFQESSDASFIFPTQLYVCSVCQGFNSSGCLRSKLYGLLSPIHVKNVKRSKTFRPTGRLLVFEVLFDTVEWISGLSDFQRQVLCKQLR